MDKKIWIKDEMGWSLVLIMFKWLDYLCQVFSPSSGNLSVSLLYIVWQVWQKYQKLQLIRSYIRIWVKQPFKDFQLCVCIETHVRPLKPRLQLQRKALPMALHTPPFWHGLGTHAVISTSQRPPVYWGLQLQKNPGRQTNKELHYEFTAFSAVFTTLRKN